MGQKTFLIAALFLPVVLQASGSTQATVTVDASTTFHRALTACALAKPMNAHALLA
jgi:transposase-like protein